MRTARSFSCFVLAATLAGFAACSKAAPADPNNRRIEWRYGPTTEASTREHLVATGTKGGAKLSQGWQCQLQDGKRLKVVPVELATSHPLFGKVALNVGFYDKAEKPIGEQMSPVLQAGNASFTLELDEKVASQFVDVVFWYVTP